MEIKLNHSNLARSLQYTSKAVNAKPNIPILSNVLLEVNKNGLKLSATNLEMGINVWIPGLVDKEGKITVSAKFISDFVNASSGENVELKLNGSLVRVKTDKSEATFNTIMANEFPVLPELSEEPLFKISTKELVTTLDKVIFACSTDLSIGKIQQSGVLFSLNKEDSEVTFVGLDGFRLSKRDTKVKSISKDAGVDQIIVPAKYLSELSKIVQDFVDLDEVDVYLSKNKSQIIFKFDEVEFSIRLIEGPYPDYKRILPDSAAFSFEVKRGDLEDATKVVNTFARSNLGYKTLFDLDLENSIVKLKSSVAEVGDNEYTIEVNELKGDSDLNTSYNLKYIQDVVSHIKGETIIFETKGPLAASVFKDKSDARFLHLLMPLRRE